MLSTFLVLFAINSNAQITDKGNFLIGGTMGFSTAESSFEIEGNEGMIDGKGSKSTRSEEHTSELQSLLII